MSLLYLTLCSCLLMSIGRTNIIDGYLHSRVRKCYLIFPLLRGWTNSYSLKPIFSSYCLWQWQWVVSEMADSQILACWCSYSLVKSFPHEWEMDVGVAINESNMVKMIGQHEQH